MYLNQIAKETGSDQLDLPEAKPKLFINFVQTSNIYTAEVPFW